jgi:hypothetical protein
MKILVLLLLAAISVPVYPQSPAVPPPPPPCGEKGVPPNVPCYKDGKLINTNSPAPIPHTPLTPGGVPDLPDPGENNSQPVTTPKVTEPKAVLPAPTTSNPPLVQSATSTSDETSLSSNNSPAPFPKQSPSGCHDFSSCFVRSFNSATSARQAARSADQKNASLIAANRAMARQNAEKDFKAMEEVRLMITQDTEESKNLTAWRADLAKDAIDQEKSAWLKLKNNYCGEGSDAYYIDLDGKEQPCKLE